MIILLDHDFRFFGASRYLKFLHGELLKRGSSVAYLIPGPTDEVPDYTLYDQDSLLSIIHRLDPRLIYVNSMNPIVYHHLGEIQKYNTIFHSHEAASPILPDLVVSESIAGRYRETVKIQKPFLPVPKIDEIYRYSRQDIMNTKITLGMCGEVSDRKNFNLFSIVARLFPQYMFIWVGGDRDEIIHHNFYLYKYTKCPYSFFRSFDYLLFTGADDPCPYVILENIILETPILLFRNSILTRHPLEFVKYLDRELDIRSMIRSIYLFVCEKKKQNISDSGYRYIKDNYSSCQVAIQAIIEKCDF